jgi:hypothetical protein
LIVPALSIFELSRKSCAGRFCFAAGNESHNGSSTMGAPAAKTTGSGAAVAKDPTNTKAGDPQKKSMGDPIRQAQRSTRTKLKISSGVGFGTGAFF